MKLKPYYPYNPIASIESLGSTLGVHPTLLLELANKADDSYTSFTICSKNGKDRDVHEPKYELKKLQKRINSRIFEKTEFPFYLQGGIHDEIIPRDYVENAKIHSHADHIICIDIKNFYPNIKYKSVINIFQHFYKFSPEVSSILTKLTTYQGHVPQGGCSSSYIANLVFYETEYKIVSDFQKHGVNYSRLLDDITLSFNKPYTNEKITSFFQIIASMFKKHRLKINNKKTKIEHRSDHTANFDVTGLWIGHKAPKARKKERRFIRQLVYICEQKYKIDPYCTEYHKIWNETSGKIAKLQRLNHTQAKNLRFRINQLLPLYDKDMEKKITQEVKKVIKIPTPQSQRIGNIKRVNKIYNKLGIMGRTNKSLAKSLRLQLNSAYSAKKCTIKSHWE